MKKKPYQVKTVKFDGDHVETKSVGYNSLEEATLAYVKVAKRKNYDRLTLLVNGLTLFNEKI